MSAGAEDGEHGYGAFRANGEGAKRDRFALHQERSVGDECVRQAVFLVRLHVGARERVDRKTIRYRGDECVAQNHRPYCLAFLEMIT